MPQHPGPYIREHIIPQEISVSEAAQKLDVGRAPLSRMLNCKASLSPDLADKLSDVFGASAPALLKMQAEYDAHEAKKSAEKPTLSTYTPLHLEVLEREITAWATNRIDARTRLAVLLRILVHSTSPNGIALIDFPGNDSGERHGWDGFIECNQASPWVPEGTSGWEFGCNKDYKSKAESDYQSRCKSVDDAEKASTTFIFVTPHRWIGKDAWVKEKKAEKRWKEVRVYDASDLEQWVQQSIPAQAWFAHETGRPTNGAAGLEEIWEEWCADSQPKLTANLFDEAINGQVNHIIHWAKKSEPTPLVIVADSIIEGLAFIKAALDRIEDEAVKGIAERCIVFRKPETLKSLLTKNSKVIPIIAYPEVERSFSPFANHLPCILIYPRNATTRDADISVEPLSYEAFRQALETQNYDRDEIERLGTESGRSLTVLRRRVSKFDAVSRPTWSTQDDLAKSLSSIALAGTWDSRNAADCELVTLLTQSNQYSDVEGAINRLLVLDDTPVWSVGGITGVVSRIDALYASAHTLTRDDLDRFFEASELILSEDDPSLDLPQEERWMKSIHGKTREFSGTLRQAIAEMTVLLAVHGNRLFKRKLNYDCEARAAHLVRRLLTPLTERKLEANGQELSNFAEISPETFISIIEEDLERGDESACLQIIRPEDTSIFGGSYARTGLLWALETLAWSAENLNRIVAILGRLSTKKLEDNLANKPSNSLLSIFRSWMPQTSANLDQRKAALTYLRKQFPNVAWNIAADQFNGRSRVGDYSSKPKWRRDGNGFGEPVTQGESIDFNIFSLEMCLAWDEYDTEKLGDLIDCADHLPSEYQTRIWLVIKEWSLNAPDEDKAAVRDKIRKQAYSRRAAIRAKRSEIDRFDPAEVKEIYDLLKPTNSLNEYAWLFKDGWIDFTIDEIGDEDLDYEARDRKISSQRTDALKVVLKQAGILGVLSLAEKSGAQTIIGHLMGPILKTNGKIAAFADDILSAPNLDQFSKLNLLRGLFGSMSEGQLKFTLESAREKYSDELLLELLIAAPFAPNTWQEASKASNIRELYWKNVPAGHSWVHEDHAVEAVKNLLEFERPFAALSFAGYRMEKMSSKLLFEILDKLTNSKEDHRNLDTMEQYHISNAFKKIDEENSISKSSLAKLELRYLHALERSEYGLPNLENEVSNNPSLFVEAVALMFKRRGEGTDPEWLRMNPETASEHASNMYHFFRILSKVPDKDKFGNASTDKLVGWIKQVQQGAKELDRKEVADSKIGELLAKSKNGQDGIWPSETVRDALEKIANEDMKRGFEIGKYNLRGVHARGEGGDQERQIESQYRNWAAQLSSTHPKVSALLNRMADKYRREAEYHDTEAKVRRRAPY